MKSFNKTPVHNLSENRKLIENNRFIAFVFALSVGLVGCSNTTQMEGSMQSQLSRGSEPVGNEYKERNFSTAQRYIFNTFNKKYAAQIREHGISDIKLVTDKNEIKDYISSLDLKSKEEKEKLNYELNNGQKILISFGESKNNVDSELKPNLNSAQFIGSAHFNNKRYYTTVAMLDD